MPGRKAVLARTLSALGLLSLVSRLRPLVADDITILAYHRVLDVADEDAFPFDLNLISATSADFRWQMTYIRKNYTPITFRHLLDGLDGKKPLPLRPILVTFDDGFDDNYHYAFPVLKSLGIPATIFVSTGYIGQPRTFWFDWLCYLYHKGAASLLQNMDIAGKSFPLYRDPAKRKDALADLYAYVKGLPDDILRAALAGLEEKLGVHYPDNGFNQSLPLNWNQVQEMAHQGIEFGSHTVTHPILSNIDGAKLHEELTASKACLEENIGGVAEVIAYPVGYDFTFSEKVIEAARQAGYRLGVTYIPGVNNAKHMDLFRLKRLHVEREDDRCYFKAMLAMPGFFS